MRSMQQDPGSRDPVRSLVTFRLDGGRYGLDIACVKEIVRLMPVTRLPEADRELRGVVNLRGRVLPVKDLRLCLGLAPGKDTGQSRIVVVERAGVACGFVVDAVSAVVPVAADGIERAPALVVGDGEMVGGVVRSEGGLLMVLDAGRLLGEAEAGREPACTATPEESSAKLVVLPGTEPAPLQPLRPAA